MQQTPASLAEAFSDQLVACWASAPATVQGAWVAHLLNRRFSDLHLPESTRAQHTLSVVLFEGRVLALVKNFATGDEGATITAWQEVPFGHTHPG